MTYSPDPELVAYRAAVDALVGEVAASQRHEDGADRRSVESLVDSYVREPECNNVLKRLRAPADAVVLQLLDEVRNFRPNGGTSAADLASLVRICLLSQIDALWWDGIPEFATDEDVDASDQLLDLGPLRARKQLGFAYRSQPNGLPGRARDFAIRRGLPGLRPPTAGLRFARARPESIAFLNELAADAGVLLPIDTPPFWVTSLVRSVQHQHRLRALGYAAVLPSAHCVGQALDIEMAWYRKFDQRGVVGELLMDRQAGGLISVIDEGVAWHVCINPDACSDLRAAFRAGTT